MMGGRDLDILEKVATEPATEEEIRCAELLSPADFEIFSHRMQMIATEALEVVLKTSGNPVGLCGDIGTCVYTSNGDPAAAGVGIWAHGFSGQLPIKYTLKHWKDEPSVGVKDGDAFVCNEILYGCIHTMDVATFMPIFHEGRLIAWSEAMLHTPDVGGNEMGGFTLTAKSRYDEGIKMPPVKIAENFALKEDIMTLMENSVRDPRPITQDNKARMAACMKIRQRILEIADKKGGDFVIGGLRKMLDEGRKVVRERVAEWNDGIYRQPVFLNYETPKESGGTNILSRVMLSLEKKGDRLLVDLGGSSPEAGIPINIRKHVVHPYGSGFMCCSHLFPDLPPSLGLTDAFELTVDEGSIFDPSEDAAICGGVTTAFAASQAALACLAKLLYDSDCRSQITSSYPYIPAWSVWGGIDRSGNYMIAIGLDFNAGGFPARHDLDGVDVGGLNVATRSDSEEAENVDTIQSMTYLFRRRGKDNFGHGKHRGGAGLEYAYIAHKNPMMVLGLLGGCGKFASGPGIFGGYGAPPFIGVKIEGSDFKDRLEEGGVRVPTSIEELLNRREDIGGDYVITSSYYEISQFNEGDIFAAMQGGGGGYGDVLERPPDEVIQDLKDDVISEWAARNIYKVAFDPDTMVIDTKGTERLRNKERTNRKRRGKRYEEFEEKWLKKRPPKDCLLFYGAWPDCM